jgi:hypothetical protein
MTVLIIGINLTFFANKQVKNGEGQASIDDITAGTMVENFDLKKTEGIIMFNAICPVPPPDLLQWRKLFVSTYQSEDLQMITRVGLAEYSGDRDMFYTVFLINCILSIFCIVSYILACLNDELATNKGAFGLYFEFMIAATVIGIALVSPLLYGNKFFWMSFACWYALWAVTIHCVKRGALMLSTYLLKRKIASA